MFDELPSPSSRLWSFDASVFWIETQVEKTSLEQTFLEGLFELYSELLDGAAVAHGSVNGSLLGPIDRHLWSRTSLTPYWALTPAEMKTYGLKHYSVLCEPYKVCDVTVPDPFIEITNKEFEEYLREVNNDPSVSTLLPVPDGSDRRDETTTIERVFFYSTDILKRWPSHDTSKPRRSRVGRVHAKIAETLTVMPVRGGRRGDALLKPAPYTNAQIARLLIKTWIERGEDFDFNQRTVERAVVNYYKRVNNSGP